MSEIQRYYYDDQDFQLELNLNNIRRELVKLLDHDNITDCFTCNRLKCRCHDDVKGSLYSWNLADDEDLEIKPPPPEMLPTPEWTTLTSIENWIRGSVPEFIFRNFGLSYPVSKEMCSQSWPSYPKSIWNAKQKANSLRKKSKDDSMGSVEDFFQYFSKKMFQND